MPGSNNKGIKIVGGISLTAILAFFALYYMISDRATESGEAKATIKMQVESVSDRVDHLETHAQETESILNGPEGVVATVSVIKAEIGNIKKQNDQIIRMLNQIKKE